MTDIKSGSNEIMRSSLTFESCLEIQVQLFMMIRLLDDNETLEKKVIKFNSHLLICVQCLRLMIENVVIRRHHKVVRVDCMSAFKMCEVQCFVLLDSCPGEELVCFIH